MDNENKRKINMKKAVKAVIIVLVAAAVVTGAVIGGIYYYGSSRAMPKQEAIDIALADAGLTGNPQAAVKCHFGRDEGMFCYKVEIWADGIEHEYSIHSETGAILERDTDSRNGHDEHHHDD